MDDRDRKDHTRESQDEDRGAFIGNRPEHAADTIPGGVQRDDARVAGNASQPGDPSLENLDESSSDAEGRDR